MTQEEGKYKIGDYVSIDFITGVVANIIQRNPNFYLVLTENGETKVCAEDGLSLLPEILIRGELKLRLYRALSLYRSMMRAESEYRNLEKVYNNAKTDYVAYLEELEKYSNDYICSDTEFRQVFLDNLPYPIQMRFKKQGYSVHVNPNGEYYHLLIAKRIEINPSVMDKKVREYNKEVFPLYYSLGGLGKLMKMEPNVEVNMYGDKAVYECYFMWVFHKNNRNVDFAKMFSKSLRLTEPK